ncbi:MAG: hypothetical protein NVS2B5_18750 [Beijerinckiaceae bacterium]
MGEIDDAHDAEDEVQPEPDQAEIKAEKNSGEKRVKEHVSAHLPGRAKRHPGPRANARLSGSRIAFVRGGGSRSRANPHGRG